MTERTLKAAVVGGGISGLSAAYYLQKQAKEQGISLDLTIIEAVHRLGGENPDAS
ncbi:FAD-dependent oxidoreductase [Planococcus sp. 107-1]|uniref:FAD-dependent oxidoreductase n=1 Tax=Planococcus sp. 107-1 TaxID=2908840 RepID=UPI002882D58E|nr:FAD-dependent oxidoreductase [Planococcus sp. 107-1]